MNNINHISPPTLEQNIIHALAKLTKEVEAVIKKLTKIESYLYDDTATSSKGVIAQQREQDKRIRKLENESKVRQGMWTAFGTAGGIIGMALWEFVKWLFTNHKP